MQSRFVVEARAARAKRKEAASDGRKSKAPMLALSASTCTSKDRMPCVQEVAAGAAPVLPTSNNFQLTYPLQKHTVPVSDWIDKYKVSAATITRASSKELDPSRAGAGLSSLDDDIVLTILASLLGTGIECTVPAVVSATLGIGSVSKRFRSLFYAADTPYDCTVFKFGDFRFANVLFEQPAGRERSSDWPPLDKFSRCQNEAALCSKRLEFDWDQRDYEKVEVQMVKGGVALTSNTTRVFMKRDEHPAWQVELAGQAILDHQSFRLQLGVTVKLARCKATKRMDAFVCFGADEFSYMFSDKNELRLTETIKSADETERLLSHPLLQEDRELIEYMRRLAVSAKGAALNAGQLIDMKSASGDREIFAMRLQLGDFVRFFSQRALKFPLKSEYDVRLCYHESVVECEDDTDSLQLTHHSLWNNQVPTELCYANGMPAFTVGYEAFAERNADGLFSGNGNPPLVLTNVISFRFGAPFWKPGGRTTVQKSHPHWDARTFAFSEHNASRVGAADILRICGYFESPKVNSCMMVDERSIEIPESYSFRSSADALRIKCDLLHQMQIRKKKRQRAGKVQALRQIEYHRKLEKAVNRRGVMSECDAKELEGPSASAFSETGVRDGRYFREDDSDESCFSDSDDSDEDYKGKSGALVKKRAANATVDSAEREHQRRLLRQSRMEDSDDSLPSEAGDAEHPILLE